MFFPGPSIMKYIYEDLVQQDWAFFIIKNVFVCPYFRHTSFHRNSLMLNFYEKKYVL